MIENKKNIGLLIIAISAIILAIIIIMLIKNNTAKTDTEMTATTTAGGNNLTGAGTATTAPTSTPGDRIRNYQKYNIAKESQHVINANDAIKRSELFAERLGSFSNQSEYNNFTDLKIMMTDNMKAWADKYVAELKSQPYSGQYSGIITHVLTSKVLSSDDKSGKTKIEVTTVRQEQQAASLSPSYQQKMTVELVKVNGEWLVDSAFWEKK